MLLEKRYKLITSLIVFLTVFAIISMPLQAAKPSKPSKPPVSLKNNLPVISQGDQPINININQNSSLTLSFNATDKDKKDTLTWSIGTNSNHGTVALKPTEGKTTSLTYKPYTDYIGNDSLRLMVTDNKGGSDSIDLNITIKPVIPQPSISYVSLGDSIATGTIYPGKTITSYVSYFYEYIKSRNPGVNVNLTRLEKDGDRTNELLFKLNNDSNMITAVRGANVITICIGGNNLMQAAKSSGSISGYDWNNINTTIADQGLSDFNTHWNQIINRIKYLNSNTVLIVNTTYNPYNTSDTTLHELVDSYLFRNDGSGLNDTINNNTNLGYSVANVFAGFDYYSSNMGSITYFYPRPWDIWGTLTRNPHPNAAGQNIIYEYIKAAYSR
ncbi:Ig-like domain-containing protein [Clostridium sp. Cult2]|uniref:Ig-like domain-containing protein n=1 Tax=Clostridium sp. Cult2 TaxID=2079003 RepID=UPI001F2B7F8B|nr:Ig-like domain-containing protein [Clostridium sp. Cult2]MCF6464800.1 hypothetical protein [Clostridium sp. Cult2]